MIYRKCGHVTAATLEWDNSAKEKHFGRREQTQKKKQTCRVRVGNLLLGKAQTYVIVKT
jgi:hypothetical protein